MTESLCGTQKAAFTLGVNMRPVSGWCPRTVHIEKISVNTLLIRMLSDTITVSHGILKNICFVKRIIAIWIFKCFYCFSMFIKLPFLSISLHGLTLNPDDRWCDMFNIINPVIFVWLALTLKVFLHSKYIIWSKTGVCTGK